MALKIPDMTESRRHTLDREREALAAIRRRVTVTRGLLALERLWRALWPALAALVTFAALGAAGLYAPLGGFAHAALLAAVLVFAGLAAWRRLRRLDWPDEAAARRRLERDNAAPHRPLDALDDSPALIAGRAALWRLHRARMMATAGRLRLHVPKSGLTAEDPYALRMLAALALLIAFLVAGDDAGERMVAAFTPSLSDRQTPMTLDVWLTPPDYTGLPPMVLRAGQSPEPVTAPAGSVLSATANGAGRAPVLAVADVTITLRKTGQASFEAAYDLRNSGSVTITVDDMPDAQWQVDVLPDRPPEVAFAAPPSESRRQALRVAPEMKDDYGIAAAELILTPEDAPEASIRVALRGGDTREGPLSYTDYVDLTRSPHAGRAAQAFLTATDAAGQTGRSETLTVTIPERKFTHPVAREIAALRLALLRRPGQRQATAQGLDDIAARPGRFDDDLTVFAVLRSAYWRLSSDRRGETTDEVAEMLWSAALRLEDGRLSMATRDLRDAMDALESALSGADGASLTEAAGALEDMMRNFLGQLAGQQGELAPDGAQDAEGIEGGQMQVVGGDIFQGMIDRIRELAAAGETDAAMAALDRLRGVMENMQVNRLSQADYERYRTVMEASRGLDDLSRAQREMLGRTGRRALLNRLRERRGEAAQPLSALTGAQGELAERLASLQDMLRASDAMPGGGEGLDRAEQAMGTARAALDREAGGSAVEGQAEAVRRLDAARESLEEAVRQAQRNMPAPGGMDPLGRPMPGLGAQDFTLPDEMDNRAVQEIRENLRRRLADPALSDDERAYLRRLLRRF